MEESDPWLTEIPKRGGATLLNPEKKVFKPGKLSCPNQLDIDSQMLEGEADELLFDPTEDEDNENILQGKSLQLSCAKCFSAIAFTNEGPSNQILLFESDYLVPIADIVDENIEIDQSKVIE